MKKNNITYNIKIQGLIINKDFTENDNEIIFTAVRKDKRDKRDTCCNHKMHIKDYRYHRHEGLAQVYRKLQEKGYTRCYDSMTRQIKKLKLKTVQEKKENRKQKKEKKVIKATRPGEQVQVDIKYVPLECIGFKSEVDRYYQITGIDVYTRKRILKLVKEKSIY